MHPQNAQTLGALTLCLQAGDLGGLFGKTQVTLGLLGVCGEGNFEVLNSEDPQQNHSLPAECWQWREVSTQIFTAK